MGVEVDHGRILVLTVRIRIDFGGLCPAAGEAFARRTIIDTEVLMASKRSTRFPARRTTGVTVPIHRGRFGLAALGSSLVVASLLVQAAPAAAATVRAGATCKKSQLGKKSGSLVCAKSGTKYVWRTAPVGSASTAAPSSAATSAAGGAGGVMTLAAISEALGATATFVPDRPGPDASTTCTTAAFYAPLSGCGGTVELGGTTVKWNVAPYLSASYGIIKTLVPTTRLIGKKSLLDNRPEFKELAVYVVPTTERTTPSGSRIDHFAISIRPTPGVGTNLPIGVDLVEPLLRLAELADRANTAGS